MTQLGTRTKLHYTPKCATKKCVKEANQPNKIKLGNLTLYFCDACWHTEEIRRLNRIE